MSLIVGILCSSWDFFFLLLLLLCSYGHALDPESSSVDEVGGRHQVFFGASKLVSQRCPNWPVLKSCFCVSAGDRTVEHALGSVGLYHTGIFQCVTGGRTIEHAQRSVGLYHMGRTVEHALGSVDLYHTGSFRCVTDPGVACGHAGDRVQFGVWTL